MVLHAPTGHYTTIAGILSRSLWSMGMPFPKSTSHEGPATDLIGDLCCLRLGRSGFGPGFLQRKSKQASGEITLLTLMHFDSWRCVAADPFCDEFPPNSDLLRKVVSHLVPSAVQRLLSETTVCNIRTLLIARNSAFESKCRWKASMSARSWSRSDFKVFTLISWSLLDWQTWKSQEWLEHHFQYAGNLLLQIRSYIPISNTWFSMQVWRSCPVGVLFQEWCTRSAVSVVPIVWYKSVTFKPKLAMGACPKTEDVEPLKPALGGAARIAGSMIWLHGERKATQANCHAVQCTTYAHEWTRGGCLIFILSDLVDAPGAWCSSSCDNSLAGD